MSFLCVSLELKCRHWFCSQGRKESAVTEEHPVKVEVMDLLDSEERRDSRAVKVKAELPETPAKSSARLSRWAAGKLCTAPIIIRP